MQLATSITIPENESISPRNVGQWEDYLTGTFREVINFEEEKPFGVCAQSWTVAAFMNLCLRNGWLDAEIPHSRFQ